MPCLLPLLKRAKEVLLCRINPNTAGNTYESEVAEIADTLTRHNVSVVPIHSQASEKEIGLALVESAVDRDADLLVIGCYGHSRMYDLLLGSVALQVLESNKLPLVMSQ